MGGLGSKNALKGSVCSESDPSCVGVGAVNIFLLCITFSCESQHTSEVGFCIKQFLWENAFGASEN
jgi:hypothetical protein